MRITKVVSILASLVLSASFVNADWITEWGGNAVGADFEINQNLGTILIKKGDDNTYKFYSETFEFSGVPGVIEDITVDPGAMGDFSILIDHPDPGKFGALDWAAGDLRHANGVSTISGIDLAGALVTSPGNQEPRPRFRPCATVL